MPYFGICLGMQSACIEFARNVCGLRDANSSEFDPATQHRIIYKLRELLGVEEMGGTMRLGAWTCNLQPDSLACRAYGGATEISERHRHRYEFNREYEALLDRRRPPHQRRHARRHLRRNRRDPPTPTSSAASSIPSLKSRPLEPHPLSLSSSERATRTGLRASRSRRANHLLSPTSCHPEPPTRSEAVRQG